MWRNVFWGIAFLQKRRYNEAELFVQEKILLTGKEGMEPWN